VVSARERREIRNFMCSYLGPWDRCPYWTSRKLEQSSWMDVVMPK